MDHEKHHDIIKEAVTAAKGIKSIPFDAALDSYVMLMESGINPTEAKLYMKTVDDFRLGYLDLNSAISKLTSINVTGQEAEMLLRTAKPV